MPRWWHTRLTPPPCRVRRVALLIRGAALPPSAAFLGGDFLRPFPLGIGAGLFLRDLGEEAVPFPVVLIPLGLEIGEEAVTFGAGLGQ